MSLSDAGWQEFTRASNIQETWIARLYYDAAGAADFFQISDRDFVDGNGNQVLGVVQDWGDIRRSIDLAKFAASIDNLSLTVANPLYHGVRLIEELRPGSARKYLNRKVEIYTELNGVYASRMQIYNGRLRGVSWTADEIKLEVEQAQPWDFIQVPDTKVSTGEYFPIVYGSFTPNTSTVASPAYCTSTSLWPAKVYEVGESNIRALAHVECGTDARPHVYEQSVEQFIPLTDSGSAYYDTAGDLEGGKVLQSSTSYYIGMKGKGVFRDSTDNDWTSDPLNATDHPRADDTFLTMSLLTIVGSPISGTEKAYTFDFPNVGAEYYGNKTITVAIWYHWDTSNYDQTLDLELYAGASVIGSADGVAVSGWGHHDATWTISGGTSVSNLSVVATVVSGTVDVGILDIRLTATAKLATTDKQSKINTLKSIETLYCGADGLARSWTTGAATELHEMHRDILHRFCGHTTTPDGWTDLDTARSGWTCRWWTHEQQEVQDVLEQAQYEGAFIFIWSMTTTGTGRYLFVKDTYSSADVAATLSELDDTDGIEYSHTPFDELVTKQVINYERHPADSRYISSYTYTNTTARTNWNIQTLENVETVDLDMLTGAVDTWAGIRDRIFGDLKRIITCDIVNPRYFILEVGDVIQLSDDTRYFMITDERRTPGRLNITAREVYA